MKLKDLLEMAPYHSEGEKPPRHWKETFKMFLSDSALNRDFTLIGELEVNHYLLEFYSRNEGRTVYGGYKIKNEYDEEGLKVVFVLEFKAKPTLINYPKDVKKKHLVQVNKVNTDLDFRDFGVAMFVYQLLVKRGLIILSDITQLDGGKILWKKMARRSHLHDYKIRILDDERGFFKDKSGNIIEYDSTNLDDSQIWTTGLDFSGEHILLLMSLK